MLIFNSKEIFASFKRKGHIISHCLLVIYVGNQGLASLHFNACFLNLVCLVELSFD